MTKISDAPLVAAATDAMKMPTGEPGDLAISVAQIKSHTLAGAVASVTGDGVDNTDPNNPVLTFPTKSDIGLGNVDNTSDVNKPVSTAQAAADAAVLSSANAHSDALVVGLWDDRGNFDASVNAYPSSGGSGTAGAILKGDIWTVSVAGTLPTAQAVNVGDTVRALIDTPGNTQANWAIAENNIGYAPERASSYGVLTDAANITWDAITNGNAAQVTLGGDRTLGALTNAQSGRIYVLRVVQDGTGGRTLAFNAAYTFPNSTTSSLVSAIAGVTIFAFFYDGTNFRCILSTGTQKFNEVHVINQAGASTKKNPLLVDDTGKITKIAWVEYDTTNQKTTSTGVDDLEATTIEEWKNLSGSSIIKILNGLKVQFGGTSCFLEVPSGIMDGNSGVIFLGSQDIAFRFKDASSFDYLQFKSSTTGYGRASLITQKQVNNYAQGFEVVRNQYKLVLPNTNAGVTHVVGSISVPSGYGISVHVLRAFAYATNGNAQGCEPFSAIGQNVGGTTSGSSTAPTALRLTATTGGFSIVWNDTSDTADLSFTNETGTGRQYDVLIDAEYILYPIPV